MSHLLGYNKINAINVKCVISVKNLRKIIKNVLCYPQTCYFKHIPHVMCWSEQFSNNFLCHNVKNNKPVGKTNPKAEMQH